MRLASLAALALLAAILPLRPAAAQVADLPLATGGTERVLLLVPPNPRAVLIMLPGGDGTIAIDNSGQVQRGGNFLIRTRDLWVQQGLAVLLVAPPDGHSLMGERHSPAYAAAIGTAADFARSRVNAPVWLVGTSQGAIAAVNGAARLGTKIAGLVVSSSVTRLGRSGETVFDAYPGSVAVPALVVANTRDTCVVSPPGDAAALAAALSASPRKEVVTFESSEIRSDPCEAMSPHGYLGIEAAVIRGIADWIKSSPARG
ncbi:MAG: alpha/beta hydrolase [Alphaproteobacteria bacterium]|nr:alpha/beta hydrolase [Alphaproteobacteria bacterium]